MNMILTHETLEGYFRKYGWKIEHQADKGLVTAFQGENGNYLFTVHITEQWVSFTVAAFIISPEPGHLLQLMTRLLSLNYSIPMVKFALDDSDNVVISIDLPSSELSYELFEVVLDILSYTADTYEAELLSLAISTSEI